MISHKKKGDISHLRFIFPYHVFAQCLFHHTPIMPLTSHTQGLFDRFAAGTVKIGHMRIILPNGGELVYGERDPANVKFEVRV